MKGVRRKIIQRFKKNRTLQQKKTKVKKILSTESGCKKRGQLRLKNSASLQRRSYHWHWHCLSWCVAQSVCVFLPSDAEIWWNQIKSNCWRIDARACWLSFFVLLLMLLMRCSCRRGCADVPLGSRTTILTFFVGILSPFFRCTETHSLCQRLSCSVLLSVAVLCSLLLLIQ